MFASVNVVCVSHCVCVWYTCVHMVTCMREVEMMFLVHACSVVATEYRLIFLPVFDIMLNML